MDSAENPIGDFLRARRRQVSPDTTTFPASGRRRRSPGLRREELAVLAGLSVAYYTRLEQGRDRHPSPQVIDALSTALRLESDGQAHLARLAGHAPAPASAPPGAPDVRPEIVHLVNEILPVAAFILNRYRDVLTANAAATALHEAYAQGLNLLRYLFLEPAATERLPDWERVARRAVASLRADTVDRPDDTRLNALIAELADADDRFSPLWERHEIARFGSGQLRFAHPQLGELNVAYETFALVADPGQTLALAFPVPGTRPPTST